MNWAKDAPETAPIRALIVAYNFPPTGGAAVGRPLKLVKYLAQHGVRAAVLTASNPSSPVRDESLLADIPPGTELVRVPTLEPGYAVKRASWALASAPAAPGPSAKNRVVRALLGAGRELLVPDAQVLWLPAASLALGRRLVRGADDVLFISGPPFSQFLLAALARLRPGTAVVLDYRDEWSTVREMYEMKAALSARVGAALESLVIRRAHVVTTATEAFRASLLERFPSLVPERVVAIPNGYDPEDFPTDLAGPPADAQKLVVTHAGTVFRLTSARGLLGAIRRVHAEAPDLARRLHVRFLGRIVETEQDAFAGMAALGVEQVGYVPHDQVIRELAASHMGLCILDELPGVHRIYPAKIFELAFLAERLGLGILTLAPPGALADLIRDHRLGMRLPPRDEAAIAETLLAELRLFVTGAAPKRPAPVGVARFDRRALAGEFAAVFRAARRVASGGGWARHAKRVQ